MSTAPLVTATEILHFTAITRLTRLIETEVNPDRLIKLLTLAFRPKLPARYRETGSTASARTSTQDRAPAAQTSGRHDLPDNAQPHAATRQERISDPAPYALAPLTLTPRPSSLTPKPQFPLPNSPTTALMQAAASSNPITQRS